MVNRETKIIILMLIDEIKINRETILHQELFSNNHKAKEGKLNVVDGREKVSSHVQQYFNQP